MRNSKSECYSFENAGLADVHEIFNDTMQKAEVETSAFTYLFRLSVRENKRDH